MSLLWRSPGKQMIFLLLAEISVIKKVLAEYKTEALETL